jgi:ribosomal protein L10
MTREEKSQVIEELTAELAENANIYLADISGLNADTTSNLRRACFKANVKLAVVKNTLLEKAMEASERDFGNLQVSMPSVEEQRRIDSVLDTCDKEIALLIKQLEALKRQKRGLMQKLLTGQIRVNVGDETKNELVSA